MKTALDFFIEQNIFHGPGNIRIDAESKFADVAGSFVRIEYFVDPVSQIRRSMDDTTVFKSEAHVFKSGALIDGGRIIGQCAVYRIPYRRCVHFSVRNVAKPGAFYNRNLLDGKTEIGIRSGDPYLIRFFHQFDQWRHGPIHMRIVQIADIIIKIFKCLAAQASQLSHGRVGPPQYAPFGMIDADFRMNGLEPVLLVQFEFGGRNI